MAIELKAMSLDELGGGMIPELFDLELGRVLRNIDDVNTEASSPRSITIAITMKPSESRESAGVTVKVSSKLAGPRPQATSVFIGRDHGELVAYLRDPRQREMDLRPTMVAMNGGADDQGSD